MKNVLLLPLLIGVTITSLTAQAPPVPPAPQVVTPGQPVTPPRAGPRAPAPSKGESIIRGYVLSSDDGSPVRRADVRAMRLGPSQNQNLITQSDAEGRFELVDLPAGRYLLSVSKTGYLSPARDTPAGRDVSIEVREREPIEKVQLFLTRGAVVIGRILDDLGDPAVNIEVRALRYGYRNGVRQLTAPPMAFYSTQRTDDRGQFRLYGLPPGDYYLAAMPRSGPNQPASQGQGLATTFYPGTQDVAEARRVRAVAGRETGPIAFALGTTRVARITGHAFNASGQPFAAGTISLSHRDPIDGSGSSMGGQIKPDGSFEFVSVAPGNYTLIARDASPRFDAVPAEQGTIRISVAGQDIEGLAVFATRAAVLRGRIVTDDGSPLPAPFLRATLDAAPVDSSEGRFGPDAGRASPRADGTFELQGLFGRRRLTMFPVVDWQIREILVNGEDAIDTGIEFGSGQVIEDAEIVITRKLTTLSGAITDRTGQPVPRATIVLFAEDERLWSAPSRFVRMSGTGEKGTYRMTGAPPLDTYLAVAVTGLEDGQWADPEFLRAAKDAGTRVRLAEGETKTLDLKVVERQ